MEISGAARDRDAVIGRQRRTVNNREAKESGFLSSVPLNPAASSFGRRGLGVGGRGLDGLEVEVKRHITAKGEVDESFGRTEPLDGVELSNSIANISLPVNGYPRQPRQSLYGFETLTDN